MVFTIYERRFGGLNWRLTESSDPEATADRGGLILCGWNGEVASASFGQIRSPRRQFSTGELFPPRGLYRCNLPWVFILKSRVRGKFPEESSPSWRTFQEEKQILLGTRGSGPKSIAINLNYI